MFKTGTYSVMRRAKYVKNLWYPYLRRIPLDIGVISGHSKYTKYIILARSRVGSNLLRGLLNSHSQITAFGEIFRDENSMDWDHMNYFQSQRMSSCLRDDPAKFIDTQLFARFPRYIKAVGFKIFYYHAQDSNVWPYLRDQTDIRILHLKRNNILQTHISRKKAVLTEEWVNTSGNGKKKQVGPLTLSYEECLQDFTQTRTWEEEYDRLFISHNVLEISYEDLSDNYIGEMRRIQEFLGVDYEEVKPETKKQSHRPLDQSISNYVELKDKFKGTQWAGFFKD